MTREELLEIGFTEMPYATIMGSLYYDLGRSRQLSVGCIGTPNEMVFLTERDETERDIIVLRNYDYDGYTDLDTIKTIITAITKRVFLV